MIDAANTFAGLFRSMAQGDSAEAKKTFFDSLPKLIDFDQMFQMALGDWLKNSAQNGAADFKTHCRGEILSLSSDPTRNGLNGGAAWYKDYFARIFDSLRVGNESDALPQGSYTLLETSGKKVIREKLYNRRGTLEVVTFRHLYSSPTGNEVNYQDYAT